MFFPACLVAHPLWILLIPGMACFDFKSSEMYSVTIITSYFSFSLSLSGIWSWHGALKIFQWLPLSFQEILRTPLDDTQTYSSLFSTPLSATTIINFLLSTGHALLIFSPPVPASFKTTSSFEIWLWWTVNSQWRFVEYEWLFVNFVSNLASMQVIFTFPSHGREFSITYFQYSVFHRNICFSNLTYINVNSEFCHRNLLLLLAHFCVLPGGGTNIIPVTQEWRKNHYFWT